MKASLILEDNISCCVTIKTELFSIPSRQFAQAETIYEFFSNPSNLPNYGMRASSNISLHIG